MTMHHLRSQWRTAALQREASGSLWHLTSKHRFALDPKHVPSDNAMSIRSREAPGLFLTDSPERWVNGYGYLRPYAVEISVPANALVGERWGGEEFLPADRFDEARILRVIPLDAYAREEYGGYGWIEDTLGTTFDTDEPIPLMGFGTTWEQLYPFKGWRYSGPDVRSMSSAEHARHEQRAQQAARQR